MNQSISLSFNYALLFDAFCALVVHGIYNRFEVEPANLLATALLLLGVPAIPWHFLNAHIESTVLSLALAYGIFNTVVASSIVLYRVSPFHPLAKYPGPLLLKISKSIGLLYASDGKQFLYLKGLHEKYGTFVRTGPNEISVVEAEAIQPVLGMSGMRKGPLWDAFTKPGAVPGVAALRDVEEHHQRRKLWNHGFTSASMKEFQPAVENRVLELVEELSKRTAPGSNGKVNPVDMAKWLSNYSFDFMGDMVFGGGFGLMADKNPARVSELINGNVKTIGLLGHIPWIVGLIHKLSGPSKEQLKFEEFALKRYRSRKGQGSTKRDLFHYLTNEEGLEKMEVSEQQSIGDIVIAVLAGADTTSVTLGGILFFLIANPPAFDRLRKEIDAEFPRAEGEPFDATKLAKMPYLNAVINETLRVEPVSATTLQRSPIRGSGGKFVAGRFVPENTAVHVPQYVLHRDPRYFSPYPDAFIPERWLDENGSKFKTDTAAFIPFSTGPANCAGKNLALLQLRMVVATLVQKFDIKFAAGYSPDKWYEDLVEFIAIKVGKLPVILSLRQ